AISDSITYNSFREALATTATYSGTPLLSEQYVRDSLGRITQKIETVLDVSSMYEYDYDAAGRLVNVQHNGTTTATYAYDTNGNRLSATRGGVTTTSHYDQQDRLTQAGSTSYTFSLNGELRTVTSGGHSVSYNYDELGNLLAVTLADGTLIEYVL